MLTGVSVLCKAHCRSAAVAKAPSAQLDSSSGALRIRDLSSPRTGLNTRMQLGLGSLSAPNRLFYSPSLVLCTPKDPAAEKKKKLLKIANPDKSKVKSKISKLGGGARDKMRKLKEVSGAQTLSTDQLAQRMESLASEEGDWELEAGADEEDVAEWNRELDGDWKLENEINEENGEVQMDLEGHEYQAKLQTRHERSEAKKSKNKDKVMEKRRKRDEMLRERHLDMYGVEMEDKDGLVGKAEQQARSNPDVPGSEDKKHHIISETMERTGGRKPRNTHPQPPGGRHERVDPLHYPEHVLWPDRPVNIHMEFPSKLPNAARTKGATSQAGKATSSKPGEFWLQEHDRRTAPPKIAVNMGIVSKSEASAKTREALHLKRAGDRGANEDEPHRPGAFEDEEFEEMSGEVKKGLGQRKREKREAELPEWARTPIAMEDLTVHKAIHGKGKSTHGHPAPSAKTHPSEGINASGVSFRDLGIGPELVKCMETNWNISSPTEIQMLTIPQFMESNNLLIADQTGTGKTLAYLLPLLERLVQFNIKNPYFKRRGQRTRALILLPNRELVHQTYTILSTLLGADERFANFTAYSMAGGVETVKKETAKLNEGFDVLVSTPDRVLLHAEHEHLYLDDTTIVVIDEADTLMSSLKSNVATQSFMQLIRNVISKQTVTHAKHVQFISASATVSPPLMEFLKKEFGNSMTSIVGSGVHRSAQTLRQDFLFGATGDFKKRLLFSTLKKHAGKRTMLFTNTQAQAKGVNTLLNKAGYNCVAMTSDMPPKIRQRHFNQFLAKEADILVATDLASRGLDMGATVEHVILYDFPTNTIDYLHRIGRTARAGATGVVTAFLGKQDQGLAGTIRDAIQEGKSLASIKPSKPDIKYLHAVKRKVPKRLPKHLKAEDYDDSL